MECESASGSRPDSTKSILRPQMLFLLDYPSVYNNVSLTLFLSRLPITFSTRKQNERSSVWNKNKRKNNENPWRRNYTKLTIIPRFFLNVPKQEIRLNNT